MEKTNLMFHKLVIRTKVCTAKHSEGKAQTKEMNKNLGHHKRTDRAINLEHIRGKLIFFDFIKFGGDLLIFHHNFRYLH